MKKRILALLMILVFSFTMVSCGNNDHEDPGDKTTPEPTQTVTGRFTPGTYEGRATGYGGEVVATVELSADRIENITCVGDSETQGVGSVAIAQMPQEMVANQTVNVDMISGATRSSTAVIEAVTQAFTSAGVDVTELGNGNQPSPEITPTTENRTVDIVIIGAGGAGMTAAIEAKAQGMNVLVLEKASFAGGNTSYATGGMNAAGTKLQQREGIDDTVDIFVQDTLKGGNYGNNEDLVRTLAQNSAGAVDWLEGIGAPLGKLSFSGGATNKRIHAPEDGSAVGPYIVSALLARIQEDGTEILYNTTATEIVMTDGSVSGVIANSSNVNYTIACEAVILATGGFGSNEEMIAQYRSDLAGFKTTNAPGITGDGITMAQAVGANVIDMEQIQVHPTVEQETSTLITESVRGQGAILVNSNGERFTNEMGTRDVVSAAIMEQEGGYAYLIFDHSLRESLAAIEKYNETNLLEENENLSELAIDIDVNAENLVKTVADYNATITNKTTDAFERTTGMDQPLSTAPYYAIKVAPAIHHTMGGVEINTNTEVINTEGNPIPGLFAAGEVTGGVHGENRIGGNAVAEVVVFGRIAGQNAASYVGQK